MRTDPIAEDNRAFAPIDLTEGQRLIVAMLADIARAPEERELDHNFIAEAVNMRQTWSLRWQYGGIFDGGNEATPETVRAVVRNFTMWSAIEHSVAQWTPEEKAAYEAQVESYDHDPRYEGYDGNAEDETWIASRLVNDLDRFSEFADRAHNAHMPTAELYGRMEIVFNEISERMGPRHRNLTPDEVASIVNARAV